MEYRDGGWIRSVRKKFIFKEDDYVGMGYGHRDLLTMNKEEGVAISENHYGIWGYIVDGIRMGFYLIYAKRVKI